MNKLFLLAWCWLPGLALAQTCKYDSIPASTPSSDFEQYADGTALHKPTGLMWKRCLEGQSWDGNSSTCTGSAKTYDWPGALQTAEASGFAGQSDWRLPNIKELQTLVEEACISPAINPQVFSETPNSNVWSGSPYAYYSNYAWFVGFDYGYAGSDGKYSNGHVRLVRGGQDSSSLPPAPPPPRNVVLLLHGMNSNPETWNDLVASGSGYFNGSCPTVFAGAPIAPALPNGQGTYCYRIDFGEYDEQGDNGLENAKQYAAENGWDMAGDFSTFEQLGAEVDEAVRGIQAIHPNARIVLLGHSRGGLAARAFLQQPVSSPAKSGIAGLVTTGTPHLGSRLGRIYFYVEDQLLDESGERLTDGDKQSDWDVIEFLLGEDNDACSFGFSLEFLNTRLDVRRPTIGYLADNSLQLKTLNDGLKNLPGELGYGQLYYQGVDLGVLSLSPYKYTVFDVKGGNPCDQLSKTAERYIVNDPVTRKIETPQDYRGDGIVTAASQQGGAPSAVPLAGNSGSKKDWLVHTDEPGQTDDIAWMFGYTGFSGWLDSGLYVFKPPVLQTPAVAAADNNPALSAEVKQRQAEYAGWRLSAGKTLWRRWRSLNHAGKAVDRELMGAALAGRLQQGEDGGIYREAGQVLSQSAVPLAERARLAVLLSQTATPSALRALLQALDEPAGSESRPALLSALERIGDYRWNQRFHAELSPLLQSAWQSAGSDARLLSVLAQALAKVGAPEGVDLLLQAVAQSGQSAETLIQQPRASFSEADSRALAAWEALHEVRNPAAVPVLIPGLHQDNPVLFRASGDALAAMGLPQATSELAQWARQADDAAGIQAAQWFGRVRDTGSKQVLRQAVSDAPSFHSQRVWEALRDTLAILDAPR